MRPQSMHIIVVSQPLSLFFFFSQTILAYFAIALWVQLGPIPLLVLLPTSDNLIVKKTEKFQHLSIFQLHFLFSNAP